MNELQFTKYYYYLLPTISIILINSFLRYDLRHSPLLFSFTSVTCLLEINIIIIFLQICARFAIIAKRQATNRESESATIRCFRR
jgi:hypothetical protein